MIEWLSEFDNGYVCFMCTLTKRAIAELSPEALEELIPIMHDLSTQFWAANPRPEEPSLDA